MRNSSIGLVVVALLLAGFPIKAHADWLSHFSYDVTVSKSKDGPFTGGTELWSSGAPAGYASSYIDIHGTTSHWGFEHDGAFYHELASSSVILGNFDKDLAAMPHVPFFLKLSVHDKASGLADSFAFGGQWKTPSSFSPALDFTGHAEGRIGNHVYKVNIGPPLGLPMGAGIPPPGSFVSYAVDAVALTATIDRIEVAHAPEPATLLMLLPASFLFGAVAFRRRFLQFN